MSAGLLASLLAGLGGWGISGVRMGNRCGAPRFTINATMVIMWWASRCVGGVMTTPVMCCSPGGRRSCCGALRLRLRGELRRRGEHPDGVAVSFVKVVELQARGIPHYHAVIRLDAAPMQRDEAVGPPQTSISAAELAVLARAAAKRVSLAVAGGDGSSRVLRLGEQR